MGLSFEAGIKKATDVDKINSAIIFGEYGTGKTWLAASADEIADYSPVLIVDVEGSSAGVGRKYPDVDIVEADTHAKFEYIINELLTTEHKYKTVIVDTLNVAQNRAEEFFKAKPENANNKFGVWGDLKNWTITLGRKLHHAPFMAILIAHAQQDKDDNTGKITTTVKIAGSAKTDLPAVPDIVGYMETIANPDGEGDPINVLRLARNTRIVTKNRFGVDDVYPEAGQSSPTMVGLQKAIIQARKDEQDKQKEQEE